MCSELDVVRTEDDTIQLFTTTLYIDSSRRKSSGDEFLILTEDGGALPRFNETRLW
jgi:hypothetical protein